ncbi:MAG: hypothetical protein ABSH16_03365 [Sedimentisphaerales bacterium]
MFKPYDPYQQINATPTPLLTIKRPDTFDLLMQENPGSDLSCFLLIAPIEETLVAGENPGSDLSCFYMHTPGAIPITGSENPDTLISCVSLYHSPEIDIAISDAPDTLISCVTLVHPIAVPITTGEEVGDAISCVSLFRMKDQTAILTGDGSTDYNFTAETSTGYFAVQDASGTIVIYANDSNAFVAGSNAFCKVWPCISAVDSNFSGDLTYLDVSSGDIGDLNLTALDVSSCVKLQILSAQDNGALVDLDLTGLTQLTVLYCSGNNSQVSATISNCPQLVIFDCNSCALTQAAVDAALAACDANGMLDGNFIASGGLNSAPSAAGLLSKASLQGKGWGVSTN